MHLSDLRDCVICYSDLSKLSFLNCQGMLLLKCWAVFKFDGHFAVSMFSIFSEASNAEQLNSKLWFLINLVKQKKQKKKGFWGNLCQLFFIKARSLFSNQGFVLSLKVCMNRCESERKTEKWGRWWGEEGKKNQQKSYMKYQINFIGF